MYSIVFLSCIAQKRPLGLFLDHIKELVFPAILWLNSFKWASSLWAGAQVLPVSIVYRSSEQCNGSQRDGLGPWTWYKARIGITSVQAWERKKGHPVMCKLDPEREIAGGKVLVLLPRLQVQHQFSD